ncbi:MAG: hypothetical protein WA160_14585 [Pseudobdellovibrio sp.]
MKSNLNKTTAALLLFCFAFFIANPSYAKTHTKKTAKHHTSSSTKKSKSRKASSVKNSAKKAKPKRHTASEKTETNWSNNTKAQPRKNALVGRKYNN